jgi:large repetitive protein
LTATLGAVTRTAVVRVLDPAQPPALASLTPPTAGLPPGGTVSFTVTLDIPAPAGGAAVSLAVEPAGAGALPASVTVPEGQLSATFDYVDGSTATTATVSASLGASTVSSTVDVTTVIGGLVINEIDYDQVSTDGAEFIEVYNGTGAPVDLAGHALLLFNGGAAGAVYDTLDLSGTLAAGQYLVVGSTAITVPAEARKIDFAGAQENRIQNGAPDGVALVNTTSGTLVDALSYEGSMTSVMIPGVGSGSLVEGMPTAVVDRNDAIGSLCRLPNGSDTNQAAADWAFSATVTPGAPNVP